MQFVIQVAINGRFSSRHMRQVVNDVTARAVTAFAATGGDPHRSVLNCRITGGSSMSSRSSFVGDDKFPAGFALKYSHFLFASQCVARR